MKREKRGGDRNPFRSFYELSSVWIVMGLTHFYVANNLAEKTFLSSTYVCM